MVANNVLRKVMFPPDSVALRLYRRQRRRKELIAFIADFCADKGAAQASIRRMKQPMSGGGSRYANAIFGNLKRCNGQGGPRTSCLKEN
jgi:hypothetical protein